MVEAGIYLCCMGICGGGIAALLVRTAAAVVGTSVVRGAICRVQNNQNCMVSQLSRDCNFVQNIYILNNGQYVED